MTKEFKEFAVQGNVMDLAIGIVIGAAFAKIVDALVEDILMPVLGLFIGPRGFENSYTSFSKDVDAAKAADPLLSLEDARKIGNVLAWGDFVTVIIDFAIIAFLVFMLVRLLNRLRLSRGVSSIVEDLKHREDD